MPGNEKNRRLRIQSIRHWIMMRKRKEMRRSTGMRMMGGVSSFLQSLQAETECGLPITNST
jgi:hypothetical protein